MPNIIVFEGATEVIVADAANINKIVKDYFLNGGRSLDGYEIYLADGKEGVVITTNIHAQVMGRQNEHFNILDLMPNVLREELIEKGLLTDEG